MEHAVQKIDHAPAQELTPLAMLDRAVSSGASPDTLERLMALQERWEAAQARKEFIAAMALARAKFGPILKRNEGYAGRYRYETLPDVMAAVDGPLSENGFNYDWVTEDLPDGRIRVTCVLTHDGGHTKRNSLSGDPKDTADVKANMNGLQRMGGAITYLQRYTLKAALGIAAASDTDGAGPPESGGLITAEQYQQLSSLIEETRADESKVLARVKGKTFESLTFKQAKEALAALENYKRKLAEQPPEKKAAATLTALDAG